MPILSLSFVVILLGAQLWTRSFLEKNLKKIFWVPVAAVFSLAAVFSFIQYKMWLENEVMKFALVASGGMRYFFFYAFTRFFAPYLLALVLSLVLFLLMIWINKRSKGRFFEREETAIAFLGGFLSGFPGFIFYVSGVLIAYLFTHIVTIALIKRKSGLSRLTQAKAGAMPLYYFWLPVSASVIIIHVAWLYKTEFWKLLSI